MNSGRRPSLLVNGLPSLQEDGPAVASIAPPNSSTTTTNVNDNISSNLSGVVSPQRDAAKLNMLRRMRPPPFQYAWTFYHDKHSESGSYDGRLTVLLENIITIKPFWEAYNLFPLKNLKMKDSVHFFKRGVKPVWEDPRNVKGGSWTFRVPKDKSEKTWMEMLLLAVGEAFADVIQPKDDLCGLSLSIRFNSNLITIWNRDGNATATIEGIRNIILEKVSPDVKPKEGSYYYKKHSEHNGFDEVITKAKEKDALLSEAVSATGGQNNGKIEEAKVKEGEREQALAAEDADAETEKETEKEGEKELSAAVNG